MRIIETDYYGESAMRYAAPHPSTLQYLQSSINNIAGLLPDVAHRITDNLRSMYDQFNGDAVLRRAKALMDMGTHAFQENRIKDLYSIGDLQQAPETMIPYLMADTTVRALYQQQRCVGYGDAYIDYQPGAIGVEHYHWRRLNTGIVQYDDTKPDAQINVTVYFDELLEGDVSLSLAQKNNIFSAQDLMVQYINRKKEDPTSQLNDWL